MKETYIKKLINLVEESQIESLEVSRWGRRVKIVRRLEDSPNGHHDQATIIQQAPPRPVASLTPAPTPAAPPTPAEPAPAEDTSRLVAIKSPMVGTFYAAPAPDADPYVSLNQKITVGQVVCIVEAMKLMNEIEAEVSGRIAKICVDNAQPVEFGQTIFLIDPD
ncbi:MAG: acetyl-CoA carboxylase biotin carboxyl carrier protein [Candidatus Zixiibacteriota bacterium]